MAGDTTVQTNALLVYLHGQAAGSASLDELAKHFGLPWKRVLDLLWNASLVEIDGYVDAYSLLLPSRPGHEEEGEEPTTAASRVCLDAAARDIPQLALTLDEVIALVAIIDSVSELTPPGQAAEALGRLRDKLESACAAAGYTGAIWPAPEPVIGEASMAELNAALASASWVEFDYYQPGSFQVGSDLSARVSRRRVIPVQVRSAVNPLLVAWSPEGVRSYRLDRIGHVQALGKASRQEAVAARRAAEDAEDWQISGTQVTLTVTGAGRWIAETLPGATSRRSGELTEVTFTSRSEEFLATLLIQLGTAVVAIEPAEVGDRLAARFAQLLEVSP